VACVHQQSVATNFMFLFEFYQFSLCSLYFAEGDSVANATQQNKKITIGCVATLLRQLWFVYILHMMKLVGVKSGRHERCLFYFPFNAFILTILPSIPNLSFTCAGHFVVSFCFAAT